MINLTGQPASIYYQRTYETLFRQRGSTKQIIVSKLCSRQINKKRPTGIKPWMFKSKGQTSHCEARDVAEMHIFFPSFVTDTGGGKYYLIPKSVLGAGE